jgi:catalase
VTDGVDAKLLAALTKAVTEAGAVVKLVAPNVGGVKASDGSWIEANEKIDGGPSVVFDAVALLLSDEGAKLLAKESTARDFVADAFAHMKFIAYTKAALPLLEKAGVAHDLDAGCVELEKANGAAAFIKACGKLRVWARADKVKQV